MAASVIYCFTHDSLNDAARKMETNHIRRIVVLNENKKLTGISSLNDIATKVGIIIV